MQERVASSSDKEDEKRGKNVSFLFQNFWSTFKYQTLNAASKFWKLLFVLKY